MDGVSAASAVLGIVSFGLQVYQTLFAFITKARNADTFVQALVTDINLTVSALRSIHELLKDEEHAQKIKQGRRLFSDEGLVDTKRTAEQCMAIFRNIVKFIVKKGKKGKYDVTTKEQDPNYLRIYREEAVGKLESINWALAQDEVELYTAQLNSYDSSVNSDITSSEVYRADILYIDDLAAAKSEAKRKWISLKATIMQKEQPAVNKSHERLANGRPSGPSRHHIQGDHAPPVHTGLPADHAIPAGGFENIGTGNRVEHDEFYEDGLAPGTGRSIPQAHWDGGANPNADPSANENLPKTNIANNPGNTPHPSTGPLHLGGNVPALPAGNGGNPGDLDRFSNSGRGPKKSNPILNDIWTSFDAYLYKDGSTRELHYTQAHIRELAAQILNQSADRWWKTFSSLTFEEHDGVEEAIRRRESGDTRYLLGIRILKARYGHFLRGVLRLVSLGMLDHRDVDSRALLIVIGNKPPAEVVETFDEYRRRVGDFSYPYDPRYGPPKPPGFTVQPAPVYLPPPREFTRQRPESGIINRESDYKEKKSQKKEDQAEVSGIPPVRVEARNASAREGTSHRKERTVIREVRKPERRYSDVVEVREEDSPSPRRFRSRRTSAYRVVNSAYGAGNRPPGIPMRSEPHEIQIPASAALYSQSSHPRWERAQSGFIADIPPSPPLPAAVPSDPPATHRVPAQMYSRDRRSATAPVEPRIIDLGSHDSTSDEEVYRRKRKGMRKPVVRDDDMISVSEDSLYASSIADPDIDVASQRVQDLLSRWTAPEPKINTAHEKSLDQVIARPSRTITARAPPLNTEPSAGPALVVNNESPVVNSEPPAVNNEPAMVNSEPLAINSEPQNSNEAQNQGMDDDQAPSIVSQDGEIDQEIIISSEFQDPNADVSQTDLTGART